MYPSMSSEFATYKIVVDGARHAGKSAILRRIQCDEFHEKAMEGESTSHIVPHSLCIEGPRLVQLELWKRVPAVQPELLFEKAHAIVFLYDLTDRASFEKACKRLRKVKKKLLSDRSDIVYALVGNKSDLVDKRVVQFEEALDAARAEGAEVCLETSAKTPVNVKGLCTVLARKLERARMPSPEISTSKTAKITESSPLYAAPSDSRKQKTKSKLRRLCDFLICAR